MTAPKTPIEALNHYRRSIYNEVSEGWRSEQLSDNEIISALLPFIGKAHSGEYTDRTNGTTEICSLCGCREDGNIHDQFGFVDNASFVNWKHCQDERCPLRTAKENTK